ncbi:hypothetical protein ACQKP0_00295 [Heyndrickxia sp. NPDC080065]|uniref:hypothetical protein n=1 Tax=Heyndrickxia sp. NPDC080065 TaxID=3390568 RepID=UPI003CFF18F2
MKNDVDYLITREMLLRYDNLNRKKKEVETELDELKKIFNHFFDASVGKNVKGEITISEYKLQRQIRTSEKFEQETTLKRLEELNMLDLIQKRPDEGKIKSALNLGLIKDSDLEGCIKTNCSSAIYVKQIDSK